MLAKEEEQAASLDLRLSDRRLADQKAAQHVMACSDDEDGEEAAALQPPPKVVPQRTHLSKRNSLQKLGLQETPAVSALPQQAIHSEDAMMKKEYEQLKARRQSKIEQTQVMSTSDDEENGAESLANGMGNHIDQGRGTEPIRPLMSKKGSLSRLLG